MVFEQLRTEKLSESSLLCQAQARKMEIEKRLSGQSCFHFEQYVGKSLILYIIKHLYTSQISFYL